MPKIEHVFVLMLENRSFDHLFGLLGLPGVNPPPASFGFSAGAADPPTHDPRHDFDSVAAQINGGAMTGFAQNGGPGAMKGFSAADVPVLYKLAKDNLLMDNWHSSMPGPTWPNRYFAHAGSSGGLDNNLGLFGKVLVMVGRALRFENGHIFNRILTKGGTWRVYRGDAFPHVLSLEGMIRKKSSGDVYFRKMKSFKQDVEDGDVAAYTFIEPDYDILNDSKNGNCMHPLGSVRAGERLIAHVYNAIFQNNIGRHSLLAIVWDEHGGFFDRERPPAATPPGDEPLNAKRAKRPRNFNFKTLGVRVPALLISPWLPKGLGSEVFEGDIFDHSSIVKALCTTFSLGPPFTKRDGAAPDWNGALRTTRRSLESDLAPVPAKAPAIARLDDLKTSSLGPISGNLAGVLQIAADMDMYLAERLELQPLAGYEHKQTLDHVVATMSLDRPRRERSAVAHRSALDYLAAVAQRDAIHERRTARRTIRLS